jgi:hypothetical protein
VCRVACVGSTSRGNGKAMQKKGLTGPKAFRIGIFGSETSGPRKIARGEKRVGMIGERRCRVSDFCFEKSDTM